MKRILFSMAIMLTAMLFGSAHAQVYYGEGTLSFGMLNAKQMQNVDGKKSSATTKFGMEMEIGPGFGMLLSEKFSIGLRTGYTFSSIPINADTLITKHMGSIQPYANYVLFSAGRFSVYATAGFGAYIGKKITQGIQGEKLKHLEDNNIYSFEIGIVPGMQYLVNRNIMIYTDLKLFEIGYKFTRQGKTIDAKNSTWENQHEFICAARMRDIFELTAVKFGVLWFFNMPEL